LANYYLFTDVTKKVIAYFILVSILSVIAEFVELPRDLYIVQVFLILKYFLNFF